MDKPFWSQSADEILKSLKTSSQGLSSVEAKSRFASDGPNAIKQKKRSTSLKLLFSQFTSPIIIILILAATLSMFLGGKTDAVIIFTIIIISGLLGFWQEKGATDAIDKLLNIVKVKALVRRGNAEYEIQVERVVPGDIVILNAGDVIPGDCLILESDDLYVDEAMLTGETFPVDKSAGVVPEAAEIPKRKNSLFMGTHVISGTATAVVVNTGKNSEFGKVSNRLQSTPPETEFERGIKQFGFLLIEVTLLLVISIFAINVYFHRPVLEAFLFSLALAVGLTPQLLPAIISVNLAHGASRMAKEKVIVKRLASIENFGSMNVLCSDKTGTLTEGKVAVKDFLDVTGLTSEKVLLYSYINASFETGFSDPIDDAIRNFKTLNVSQYKKWGEIPYDFNRKRISIFVSSPEKQLIITKGAFSNILDVCTSVESSDGKVVEIDSVKDGLQERFENLSKSGFRVLGVAYREGHFGDSFTKDQERDMVFLGFLVLFDPPKEGVSKTIADLKKLGVDLKIITGDNEFVSSFVSKSVGFENPIILKGSDLRHMSDEALAEKVNEINVFAEIEPNQKERIILTLRKAGNVVGYLGDGINDASALHAADVGISVDTAVDVAKEAAYIVLLEKDLEVLVDGIQNGRQTFANTLKYVFMATSANFGNMFSMAGASLFLPFLPLLTKQILLMNLLTDLPEMTIASDSVDPEMIEKPRRWDIKFIRKFMLIFGSISSIFDFATFGVLLLLLHANIEHFRTGWFMESVISASVIVLVVRTRRLFWQSRPGKYLLATTLMVVAITLAFPFLPINKLFGFDPIPAPFFAALFVIMALYILLAEIAKKLFYSVRPNPHPD